MTTARLTRKARTEHPRGNDAQIFSRGQSVSQFLVEVHTNQQAETSLFCMGPWDAPIFWGPNLRQQQTLGTADFMRAGIRRSCFLSKKRNFFPKEATFALVSVTHWPKIHHTLSLRESLWEGNSLGQEELGKQSNGESRASWLWTKVPRRLQPLPRVCSRRRAGSWPHKTLLNQKMPELLISSATPDFPKAVLYPAVDALCLC